MIEYLILKIAELFKVTEEDADTLLYAFTIFGVAALVGIIHLICLNI